MKAIYNRVSTDGQEFAQQMQCIYSYLKRIGEDCESMLHVEEKVSGSVKHTERKLYKLLQECESGSTIYISELSRLGRNMSDLFQIVTEATEKGITIIQCKDGTIIENNSIGGKALLFALSLAAEIELNNIRQRTKSGLDSRRRAGKAIGGTKELWGRKTGTDREKVMNDARIKSAQSRRIAAQNKPENKDFWNFMDDWQQIHGQVSDKTDWQAVSDKLNSRGKTTSTGLPFDKNRAKAMYVSMCKIYGK